MGLFDFLGQGTSPGPLNQGFQQATNAVNTFGKKADTALTGAQTQYTPQYLAAANAFSPFLNTGASANAMELAGLGVPMNAPPSMFSSPLVNAPAAAASGKNASGKHAAPAAVAPTAPAAATPYAAPNAADAFSAFRNNSGYQFALDEASRNALRNQAATGALNSGNTLEALSDRAQNLQNQTYGDWLNRLHGLGAQGIAGATGLASGLTNLGQAIGNTGEQRANNFSGMGSALANLDMTHGNSLTSLNANNSAANTGLAMNILGLMAKAGGAFA